MSSLGAITAAAPRVLAHRGFHDDSPIGPWQNSMGAFQKGAAAGVDALELDVRRTHDGVLVVHHDATPTGGGPKISALDLAQLPHLPDGQPIPTLAEVAGFAKTSGAKLAVELKESGYEREVVDTLHAQVGNDQFEVISFSPSALRAVKAADPEIRTGLLAPRIPAWLRESAAYPIALWALDTANWMPAINHAVRLGADYLSVDHRMASPKFLAEAATRHVPVDVWTVNTEPEMQRLIAAGVQGIVTDDPASALRLRAEGAVVAPPAGVGTRNAA
ncbi:MAG: Glycerophosphoryl diester phosphodiesterase [Thermoleophilia bacterium]|nr:Glycerophosphoryl diester phosphodiesterase [Thermoleophilia bacterium]